MISCLELTWALTRPPSRAYPRRSAGFRPILRYLGEDITNELVNWFNAVDATYRGERLTTLRADLDTKWTERWTALDARMSEGLAELSSDVRAEMAQVRNEMSQLETKLADRLGQVKSDLLKWMLTFWVSTLLGLGALFFRR